MWRIEGYRQADKELSPGRIPVEILKRYEKWKDIAMLSGPQGRGLDMRNFTQAKKRVDVTLGESVRIIRELQGLAQTQLSEVCGIPQTTISGIETGRVNLGVERAKTLATALQGWQLESAA